MQGLEVVITASAGMNVLILGATLWSHYRIGRLEGAAKNGAFFDCPFYRKKLNNTADCDTGIKGQQNGKDIKRNTS